MAANLVGRPRKPVGSSADSTGSHGGYSQHSGRSRPEGLDVPAAYTGAMAAAEAPHPESEQESALDHFWAVVPAGGSGTRLWPLSRQSSPKFLHDLTGSGRSLIQETVERLRPLCSDRLLIVTGSLHVDAVRDQLPQVGDANLLIEPSPRESMPAIGLAAAVLERRDPDAVLGSFAADHVIGDPEEFRACLLEAVNAASSSRAGDLVTLGIEPTYPSTGFGYIAVGDPDPRPGAASAHRVVEFVEKPGREVAETYLRGGRHRWNAGIFVVRATALLELLSRWHPQMVTTLRRIAAEPELMDELWPTLTSIAIDHAVAEPAAAAGHVLTIPAGFRWDDIGDFASLATQLADSGAHPGLRVLGPDRLVIGVDSTGVVAANSGRTVVTLGVPDVVIIDTEDAVLVTTRDRVQDVKGIVATLRSLGRDDLT